MTIHTLYFVFGYQVRLKDYMTKLGYTPEQYVAKFPEGAGWDNEQLGEAVMDWFLSENLAIYCSVGAGKHVFTLNGVEYIARQFTHDQNENGDMIVGLVMGSVDLDGNIDMRQREAGDLDPLVEEWGPLLIGPAKARSVTDDCQCCS